MPPSPTDRAALAAVLAPLVLIGVGVGAWLGWPAGVLIVGALVFARQWRAADRRA